MNEDEPTADEIAESAALVRALDGELPAGAEARVLAHVDSALAARRHRSATRRRLFWLAPLVLAPAAALVVVFRPSRPADRIAAAAPAPTAALLHAQAEAARRGPKGLAMLDDEMKRYRASLLASLEGGGR